MREYPMMLVDVFTDRPFGGNPLVVVLDATGLADDDMWAIAREIPQLPATTFVLPPTNPESDARVRIFTATHELPFSGHSTLGTAYVLATRRSGNRQRIILDEDVGLVEVELEGPGGAPAQLWVHLNDPTFGEEFSDRAGIARALGVTEVDLLPGLPIQAASSGLPFLYVPLRDRDTVDRVVLDVPTLLGVAPGAASLGIFVFAPDPDPAACRVYSRMLAPHTFGIPEDPATGAASGPLGAYLVRYGLIAGAAEVRIASEQGTKMRRQGFVHIALEVRDGQARDIRVGGSVVPVLEGVLRLP